MQPQVEQDDIGMGAARSTASGSSPVASTVSRGSMASQARMPSMTTGWSSTIATPTGRPGVNDASGSASI